MSRYFAIQSWVSSHDNEPDYSGQQTGSRDVRSVEIPMFTQHGKANVDWFSDEQIALRSAANKPKSSIKDKILPQSKRLSTLQSQMLELENSYRAGEVDIKTYSLLRDVVVAKIQRQEVLLKRASSVKPLRDEIEDYSYQDTHQDSAVFYTHSHSNPSDNTRTGGEASASWVDEISDRNSFKKILQIACKVIRKLVEFKHKAAAYYQTLKEV